MIEDQAFAAIRNALRLENLSRDLASKVTPELAAIFKSVRETLRTMPPGQLEREIRYKQIRLQLASMFTGPNATFYRELKQGLDGEVLRQVEWARDWIKIATSNNPEQEVIASIPRDGVTLTPSTGGIAIGDYQFTRTQLVQITQDTKVLGRNLEAIFMPDEGFSAWIKDNLKLIDTTVKRGFLLGETNEEIANQLPGMGRLAVTRNRAIARTAVMDMSQRAHERFWDENTNFDWTDPETGETREVRLIKLWEFDATFDYRVCPQCFPYDGKRAKDRSSLPSVPRHPNCRCRVLPLTATALELEKEDMAEGMKTSMVEINKNANTAKGRVYKTKARVGNRKYTKSSQDIEAPVGQRPTMGLFLLRANQETREAVLGKTNAKRFGEMVKGTDGSQAVLSANDALREIVKNPARRRK